MACGQALYCSAGNKSRLDVGGRLGGQSIVIGNRAAACAAVGDAAIPLGLVDEPGVIVAGGCDGLRTDLVSAAPCAGTIAVARARGVSAGADDVGRRRGDCDGIVAADAVARADIALIAAARRNVVGGGGAARLRDAGIAVVFAAVGAGCKRRRNNPSLKRPGSRSRRSKNPAADSLSALIWQRARDEGRGAIRAGSLCGSD